MMGDLIGRPGDRCTDHCTPSVRRALRVILTLLIACALLPWINVAVTAQAVDTSCNHGVGCTVELQLANTTGDQGATITVGGHNHIHVTVPASFTRRLHAGAALFTPLSDGFAFSTLDTAGMILLRYDLPANLTRDAAT